MSKTFKVAAGLCLMVTTVWAQLPQVAELPTQRLTSVGVSMEQMKMEFDAAKMQQVLPMKSNLEISVKGVSPITELSVKYPQVMTRSTTFKAYYEKPTGVYNIKAGFQYGENLYSRHGILAPIYQDVVFKNASTLAVGFDWYINNKISYEENATVVYVPGGTNFYEPLPELTAYAANGAEDIFQYGYCLNPETKVYDEGQAVTVPMGMVHNLDAGAESFYNTYIATKSSDWSEMLFGSDSVYKPSYVEIFEEPLHSVVLNSVYTYIACPVNHDLSSAEFSVYVMEYTEANGWVKLTEKVTAKPGGRMGQLTDECDVWYLYLYLEKPLIVDKQFALVLDGPQDGVTPWAFMHQNDRDLSSQMFTAGYIPSKGDYAGYVMPYALMNNGEAVAYPASIDLGLEMYMPYNMVIDTLSYSYLNFGNEITVNEVGMKDAGAYLWNWYAYLKGGEAQITLTSNMDWLKADMIQAPLDTRFMATISVSVDELPEGVTSRSGVLTIADNMGYKTDWTFHQVRSDGIEENVVVKQQDSTLDPNAPVFDLTGRRVNTPTKGIYLQNGKKFVVK